VTNTFSGIRPIDVPGFIVMQFIGAIVAILLFRWLVPDRLQKEVPDHVR